MNISGMNWKEAVYVHLIENRQKNMNGKLRQMLLKNSTTSIKKWEQQIMGDGYMDIHPIFEYEYKSLFSSCNIIVFIKELGDFFDMMNGDKLSMDEYNHISAG